MAKKNIFREYSDDDVLFDLDSFEIKDIVSYCVGTRGDSNSIYGVVTDCTRSDYHQASSVKDAVIKCLLNGSNIGLEKYQKYLWNYEACNITIAPFSPNRKPKQYTIPIRLHNGDGSVMTKRDYDDLSKFFNNELVPAMNKIKYGGSPWYMLPQTYITSVYGGYKLEPYVINISKLGLSNSKTMQMLQQFL